MAKRRKKLRNLDSYALGTTNTGMQKHSLPSPQEFIHETQLEKQKAIAEASTDPLVVGLQTTAQLLPLVGGALGGIGGASKAASGAMSTMSGGGGGHTSKTGYTPMDEEGWMQYLNPLDKFENGGTMGDPPIKKEDVKDAKDWMMNYHNSPMFKERFLAQGKTEQDYENAKLMAGENLNETQINYFPGVGPSQYKDFGREIDIYGSQTDPNNPQFGNTSIPAHEFSHSSQAMYPKMISEDIQKYMKDNIRNVETDHDFDPEETRADINATRYLMNKEGINDAGKQKFTKKTLDSLRDNETIKNDGLFNRLQRLYDDKSLIQLMNRVAKADEPMSETQYAAYGGYLKNGGTMGVNAEVEGGEVFETPDGKMGEFQGPSHENGGIPIQAPEGTKIFSKQLKIGGKSMAERKKAREAKLKSLGGKLKKSPTDKILKDSFKKTTKDASVRRRG